MVQSNYFDKFQLYLKLCTLFSFIFEQFEISFNFEEKAASNIITLFRVRADKEVILSAGSINSPQILMLSGVGPKAELEMQKIPVIENLKVGHNLQDHVALGGLTFLINKPDSITLDQVYSVGKKTYCTYQ